MELSPSSWNIALSYSKEMQENDLNVFFDSESKIRCVSKIGFEGPSHPRVERTYRVWFKISIEDQ